jgi:hypothetical protein
MKLVVAYTVMIREISTRSLSPLDATSLYESNSFEDEEMKLKFEQKQRERAIKRNSWARERLQVLRYFFFFYGDVYTKEPMRIESWRDFNPVCFRFYFFLDSNCNPSCRIRAVK